MGQRPVFIFYLLLSFTIVSLVFQGKIRAGAESHTSSLLIIAHRGGYYSGLAENTLPAFKRAIMSGADIIELDLRSSRDGEIFILHDATLDRTTNGKGPIEDYQAEELKRLDAGNGEQIPTYEEVLELIGGTGVKLLLDIKTGPVLNVSKIVRLTEFHGKTLDVIAGVRTVEDLDEIKKHNPNIRTLGFIDSPRHIDSFIKSGVDIIRLWPKWIVQDQQLLKNLQKINRPVWVTVPDPSREELEDLLNSGVNGLISDFPEKLKSMLEIFEK